MPTPVYAYARYSSENQRDESINTQLSYIRDFAEKNGCEIIQTYADEATSGTNTEGRKQFQNMLREIRAKREVQAILVWDITRYARNTEEAISIENQLLRLSVEIIAVTQPMRTIKEDGRVNTSALTFRRMLHVMSEATSFQISEQTAAHMYSQSQRPNEHGYHPHLAGSAPYGYKLSERKHYKDHRYLEINESEAPAVRYAWQWIDEGMGYREIAERLNEMGYSTRKSLPFSHTSIYEMTHNSIYAGIYSYGKMRYNSLTTKIVEENPDAIVVVGGAPAIITMGLHERVKNKMDSRKTGRQTRVATPYLLSGLVYCKYCSAPAVGDSSGKKREATYRCNGGNTCKHPRWRTSRNLLDRVVVDLMVALFIAEVSPEDIARGIEEWEVSEGLSITDRIKQTRAEILSLEKKISDLVDVLLEAEVRDAVKKKIIEAQNLQNDLKRTLVVLEESEMYSKERRDSEYISEILETSMAAYREWDHKKLKNLLNIFVEKVEIAHYGAVTITWKDESVTEVPAGKPDPGHPSRRAMAGKNNSLRDTGYFSESLGTAKIYPYPR